MCKIHIPEPLMDEFAKMKIQADQSTLARRTHACIEFAKLGLGLFYVVPLVVRTQLLPLHRIKDVKQPAIPEGLAIEPHMRTFVEIELHSPVTKRIKRLRCP